MIIRFISFLHLFCFSFCDNHANCKAIQFTIILASLGYCIKFEHINRHRYFVYLLCMCLLHMTICPPDTIGGKFQKKLHKYLMEDKDDEENPMFTHKFCTRKVYNGSLEHAVFYGAVLTNF